MHMIYLPPYFLFVCFLLACFSAPLILTPSLRGDQSCCCSRGCRQIRRIDGDRRSHWCMAYYRCTPMIVLHPPGVLRQGNTTKRHPLACQWRFVRIGMYPCERVFHDVGCTDEWLAKALLKVSAQIRWLESDKSMKLKTKCACAPETARSVRKSAGVWQWTQFTNKNAW